MTGRPDDSYYGWNAGDVVLSGGKEEEVVERGGPGSGHHGHKGRPGEVGGSLPSGATATATAEPGPFRAIKFAERALMEQDLDLLSRQIAYGDIREARNERVQPGDNHFQDMLMDFYQSAKMGLRFFPEEGTDTDEDVLRRAFFAYGHIWDWLEREGIDLYDLPDDTKEAIFRIAALAEEYEPHIEANVQQILDNIGNKYTQDRRDHAEKYVNATDDPFRRHQIAMIMADGMFNYGSPRIAHRDFFTEVMPDEFPRDGYDPEALYEAMVVMKKPYTDQSKEMVMRTWLEFAQQQGTGEWGFAQAIQHERGISPEWMAYNITKYVSADQWVPTDEESRLWPTAQFLNDGWQSSTQTFGGIMLTEIASEIWGGESIDRERNTYGMEEVSAHLDDPQVREEAHDFLRAMYDRQQADFEDWGIEHGDTIRLYRGMNNAADERWNPDGVFGDARVDMWSLSSWSSNIETAHEFARGSDNGAIVVADVPIIQILTEWSNGFPAKGETEYIVLGRDGIDAKVYFKDEGRFTMASLDDPDRFQSLEDIPGYEAKAKQEWKFHIDEIDSDWIKKAKMVERGGPGSGHHGHKGRPGKVGGSLPRDAQASLFPEHEKSAQAKVEKIVETGQDVLTDEQANRWDPRSYNRLKMSQEHTEDDLILALRMFYQRTGIALEGMTISDDWNLFAQELLEAEGVQIKNFEQFAKEHMRAHVGSLGGAYLPTEDFIFVNTFNHSLASDKGTETLWHEVAHRIDDEFNLSFAGFVEADNNFFSRMIFEHGYDGDDVDAEYVTDLIVSHVRGPIGGDYVFWRGDEPRLLSDSQNEDRKKVIKRLLEWSVPYMESMMMEEIAVERARKGGRLKYVMRPEGWVEGLWVEDRVVERGGPGSGHHGHRGRPGEVGGSLPAGAAVAEHPIEWFDQDKYQAANQRLRELKADGQFAVLTRIGANFVVVKDMDTALDIYAKSSRSDTKEHLYLLDSGEGQVFRASGTRSAVRLGFDDQRMFREFVRMAQEAGDRAVAIHNHPSKHGLDFPPSMSDFQFAMGFKLDEFRVAAKTGQWIVRNTGKVEKFGGSHMEELASAWTQYAKDNLEKMTGIVGDPYTLKEPEHRKRMLEDADYAAKVTEFHKQRFLDVTADLGWYEIEWKSYE